MRNIKKTPEEEMKIRDKKNKDKRKKQGNLKDEMKIWENKEGKIKREKVN